MSRQVLARMTDVMTHRGPNDRGEHWGPGIGLGVRRLSIIDVAGGHQPFSNEERTIWAIQNGELYNHNGVRAGLTKKGHRFTSRCDTEILPHLYEDVRDDLPNHLRGKFAIALWDAAEHRMLVARDRLGVKPLYYAMVGDLLVFGSELKAVLASGLIEPSLDVDAIDAYLTLGFFPGPLTPLRQVRKLEPGHRLVVDGNVRIEPYWSFPQPEPDPRFSEEECAEQLLAAVEEAIELRLMSDVPLGAMLSGGLDSSLMLGLMARKASQPVKTFSVGFAEDRDRSELADARMVAEVFGADHHELELTVFDMAPSLEDLVWALDEPLADLSALGFMLLSELAAKEVTVAMAGQGVDELFGGYPRHARAATVDRLRRLPSPVTGAAAMAMSRMKGRMARFAPALNTPDPARAYLAFRAPVLGSRLRAELAHGPLLTGSDRAYDAVARHARSLNGSALGALLYLDAKLGLVDDMLHYSDRVSMAHSLEVRVPFLDHEVVELASRIPTDLKVCAGTTKYLIKRIARGLVPDPIIDKPKTGFFNHAVDMWLQVQLNGQAGDFLLDPQPAFGEFLDGDRVRTLVADRRKGTAAYSNTLYAILMLEVWLKTFLPRAIVRNN